MSRNKFNAKRCRGYASRREAKRAAELQALQAAGIISDLREQVDFELIPAQYEYIERYGKKGQRIKSKRVCIERSCHYVADFVYLDKRGHVIVEDAKGFSTPEYRIKRKLLLQKFGLRVHEV